MSDWQQNLIEDDAGAFRILHDSKRIAVLGIKTEQQAAQPAFYVPAFLQRAGYEIVPVPVYYPEATSILGQPVYRTLAAVPGPIDLVVVFRRPRDILPHVRDILEKKPWAVWFQLGIRNDEAARALAAGGIEVVQDRCTMVEVRRMGGR